MPVLTVGLTGGVASGKTLAARSFVALGVPLLDADDVSREVAQPGTPVLAGIAARFGTRFLQADGTLDRRALRAHVFADPAELRALEAITHPAIRSRLVEWRDAQAAPYCILAVPILVEAGMHALVDRVLVVDVPEEVQVARLVARDGTDEGLARRMIAAQAPRAARLARANDVLRNAGPPEELADAVRRLHEFYLGIARTGTAPAGGLHLP